MKKIASLLVLTVFLLSLNFDAVAQNRNHQKKHRSAGKRVVVYKHSRYRPHRRVKVFHPYWNPGFAYKRRWIFFPKYNIYWDNWRNQYVFLNNNVWVMQAATPPVIMNINLDKEEHQELSEDKDDIDEIYRKLE